MSTACRDVIQLSDYIFVSFIFSVLTKCSELEIVKKKTERCKDSHQYFLGRKKFSRRSKANDFHCVTFQALSAKHLLLLEEIPEEEDALLVPQRTIRILRFFNETCDSSKVIFLRKLSPFFFAKDVYKVTFVSFKIFPPKNLEKEYGRLKYACAVFFPKLYQCKHLFE